ncbi:CDP-diacylglycerol--serine O-phosphatidyltransferase [Brevibacillus daliensis]|uniref:CDP-diacylglycerol--serine O-phosphatidyltransferase n=1 Tax=Brevibacillus daliensis TaxID=2892995 RepID=UPI001E322928|nr:CDP-diacylglycerol--serine O-phosphatidyltransferase [Brevibacillus daliensis]
MIVKALPNLLTLGNLFLGIVAMVLAFSDMVDLAAITVIVAMLLDGLDGRVARMLNAQSEFGKELDSLSDVISFGVAPAFIMYVVALQEMSFLGILITGMFPICGALRLARFNVQAGVPGYFIGLPITAAGGVLATLALFHEVFPTIVLSLCMLMLAYLMVSKVKYPNFKKVGIPKSAYWIIPIIVVGAIIIAVLFPSMISKLVFVPLALYALYGIKKNVEYYIRKSKKKDVPEEEHHTM